jgi:O-methyltransferase
MKQLIINLLHRAGYDLIRRSKRSIEIQGLMDLTVAERSIITAAQPFTMTSHERMASLVESTKFIVENNIEGDIVECGVWRGGSMMIIASVLMALGDTSRSLYLYDTYQGMSQPSDDDVDFAGNAASTRLLEMAQSKENWCEASLEDVQENLFATGYPSNKIHFIKGTVEETIPATIPQRIALLRLDTDWYESTKHELTHLYPLLNSSGILIIDDYGHWQGAKKAVDEFFKDSQIYLHRIDYTGRLVVKPASKQGSAAHA